MSRNGRALAPVVLVAAWLLPGPAGAATGAPIESVALIDIMPGDQAAARRVLETYLGETPTDPGLLSARLLLQTGTSNHFVLLQSFRDADAAEAHARLPFVRAYRAALFPHLGSPYDERFGSAVLR